MHKVFKIKQPGGVDIIDLIVNKFNPKEILDFLSVGRFDVVGNFLHCGHDFFLKLFHHLKQIISHLIFEIV